MKTSRFVASTLVAVAALAGGSAFAEGSFGYLDHAANPSAASTSTLSRAQVQAEVAQARRDGTLVLQNDNRYPVEATGTPSSKTRAEVQAEYRAAREAGLIPLFRS